MKRRLVSLHGRVDQHGLLRVGGAMLAARGVSVLTGIGLAVLLARTLGAEGYGFYIFALTLAFMLSMPVQMGLPTLLMRQVAIYRSRQDWAHLGGIVRWSVAFVVLSLATVSLVAGGYLFLREGTEAGVTGPTQLYSWTLVLVGMLCFMQLAAATLHGFERVFWSSLPDGVIRPVLLLALVLTISRVVELTPTLVMALHAAAAAVALAWAGIMVARHCRLSPAGMAAPKPQFETRAWVASLLPLTLITGAAMINSKLDLFMLGMLSTKENVGNYAMALQIAGLVVVVQTIVNSLISPKIARLYASGHFEELQTLITNACRLSALAALACVAAILAFAGPVVLRVIGQDFGDVPGITMILSMGLLLSAALGPASQILNMIGQERTTARIILYSAILNAALNSILIPTFGAHGAAVASVTTVLFIQFSLVYLLRQSVGMDSTAIGRQLRKPLANPVATQ